MLYKKINLFCAAVIVIVLIFSLPEYNKWLTDKIIYGADYGWQTSHLATADRMINRFGADFTLYQALSATLKKLPMHDSSILVPPPAYVKAMKAPGWPEKIEPEAFYYFTGFKSVGVTSPMINDALFAIVLENHKVSLRKITNKATLDEIVASYTKYK